MSIDHATGDLWVGDVGWELWEMIYRVERGGNYGWSIMEGPQPVQIEGKRGPDADLCRRRSSIPTPRRPRSPAATSITAHACPSCAGAYVYGDYQTGIIWGLRHDGQEGHLEQGARADAAAPGRLRRGATTVSSSWSTTTGPIRSIAWCRTPARRRKPTSLAG